MNLITSSGSVLTWQSDVANTTGQTLLTSDELGYQVQFFTSQVGPDGGIVDVDTLNLEDAASEPTSTTIPDGSSTALLFGLAVSGLLCWHRFGSRDTRTPQFAVARL
jgi:hypothetical protein